MIAAIYATGPNGEFGLNGKLPWGSFKEELDIFYATLDSLAPDNIIVGAGTWLAFPETLQKRILGDSDLFIYANRPLPNSVGSATRISNIGYSLPDFLKEEVTVVLGGATLLLEMYVNNHLDMAYVSTINSVTPLSADVHLHHHITMTNSTATRMDYAVGHNADKSLSFVQELVTY
ncbi:dihydrofolate reductase [Salmonella phage falkor]|uniref:Dihydrofolate reductase n=20 Tax=Viruses TaxID=10239 RepID=A0A6G8RDA3_9CAUD|nr:dihydrofolate reductase [Escherichia phage saus132]YP_009824322.1 putative dihydrofolate reductase [Escherichia phage vB_Eco_mar003J3]YP_009848557.1 dihydrofolate reductase [Salmonella phage SE24]YP_009857967.1 dihydrofolate reductase [Salmonella phage bombadil]YP_009858786.1 dihydrofolate reductase [Salmonella phage oselot]YP_009858964.1 dihydrofolate reductase [Salmonella phage atrejo]ASU02457.1 dihydrofolate reductase [Bacteriophage T5-like chee130_1]ASU02762.1 dihydrofolate reductase 